jgi:uracil-DNA glycosylase family 4
MIEEELRAELASMLDSVKCRILWNQETGQPQPFTRQKGRGQLDLAPEKSDDVPGESRVGLEAIRAEMGDCQRCSLGALRKNLVFGVGNPKAALVFVGEAPGADEDREGEPFVGRAGQLLTKIIEAMGLARRDVYICNILKCRPPGNRDPEAPEIAACEPFLIKQLQAIAPQAICALGTFAAQTLLKKDIPISSLRGRFHTYSGIKVMPTYHPAYLLRNPSAKKMVWEDVQMIMNELGIKKGAIAKVA